MHMQQQQQQRQQSSWPPDRWVSAACCPTAPLQPAPARGPVHVLDLSAWRHFWHSLNPLAASCCLHLRCRAAAADRMWREGGDVRKEEAVWTAAIVSGDGWAAVDAAAAELGSAMAAEPAN